MAAENQSPAREPATRGRGRGGRGRGGRGRGGGRGASNAAVPKSTATKPGRGGSRRGRAKNFSDSRVQAAYERQRDLKATYQAVAHALKPALQELAERSVDEMLQQSDSYRQADEHFPVIKQLQENLAKKIAECDGRLKQDLQLAENIFNAESYVTENEFKNGIDEMAEQFYQSQENRLRILYALQAKGLPVDVRDDQYEYKVITDEQLDHDFGIYECYKNGNLVPYPSRVEGTEMWRKLRNADAAVAATVSSTPTRGRGRGRGGIKRRAQEQPDGQPTPKKSTRALHDSQFLAPAPMAPAPAKGLLASAAEVDTQPEGTPGDEESAPVSPEPPSFNGIASNPKAQARLLAREKSPPLPKNIAEPDDYGFRIYNQKPSLKEKGINSRLLAPHMFRYEDSEIGFRDSSNDSTKGHTRAKRGKYLDTPNSNGMHFDHWCNGYDYSSTKSEDFDQEKVNLHGIHPTYGIFLPTSNNDVEEPNSYNIPGKPVVYIANPSGRISHASRSFQKTINHRRAEEAPLREKMGASMRRFCKMADINQDDIAVSEFLHTNEDLLKKSLGTAVEELESRPSMDETPSEPDEFDPTEATPEQPEGGMSGLSVLTYATAFVEAQEVTRIAPPPPKPARYDAIRDVFTDSKPTPSPIPASENENLGLSLLAELCNVETRYPESSARNEGLPPAIIASDSDMRATLKHDDVPSVAPFPQVPLDPVMGYAESPSGYMHHQHRERSSLSHGGPVHAPVLDAHPYPVPHEHGMSQPPPVRSADFRSHPPPPVQDQGVYFHQQGYPMTDPRDAHMPPGRPMDPVYNHRRMSGYGSEPPPPPSTYQRIYWPPQQQLAPGPSAPIVPGPSHQHYAPPPTTHSRMPFSQNGSAEPLPPLRPPRGRNQSLQEDVMIDPAMRSSAHQNMSPYYPPAPSRAYHRSYSGPDSLAPMQPMASDRILPNPQHPGQSYMRSPSQGYTPQILSPTFGNPQLMAGQMAQSPPGTPQGPPGSAQRHRSTPSGSSDAGNNKYRKLQPAPVPAHRAWSNKPELKTIPYDHKETGSSAALPSSGPTQIRGWNVNQPRKRSKAEKQERADSVNDRDDSR